MLTRISLRALIVIVLIPILSSVPANAVEAEKDRGSVAWGVTVGSPQMIALTLETHQNQPLRLQLNFGTIILASSLNCRLLLTRVTGDVRPYAFLGGGLLHFAECEGGGGCGWTGLVWGGGGIAVPVWSIRLFGEIGIIGGMDEDKGYESPAPAVAVGILFNR
jgi:hypothetical protein